MACLRVVMHLSFEYLRKEEICPTIVEPVVSSPSLLLIFFLTSSCPHAAIILGDLSRPSQLFSCVLSSNRNGTCHPLLTRSISSTHARIVVLSFPRCFSQDLKSLSGARQRLNINLRDSQKGPQVSTAFVLSCPYLLLCCWPCMAGFVSISHCFVRIHIFFYSTRPRSCKGFCEGCLKQKQ